MGIDFSELKKLLNYHLNPHTTDILIEITDPVEMALICELLSIGYLDLNVITVHRENDAIYKVVYNKNYPLTEQGDVLLQEYPSNRSDQSAFSGHRRIILLIISVAVLAASLIYFIL